MTDLSRLQNRDYVLVLDKSGSMGMYKDCAGGKSRWEAAQESTLAIASKITELDPDGIKVVPFAGSWKTYDNTTAEKVAQVFAENEPMGSTNLAGALQSVFDDYLSRKKAGKTQANGEITLVVTDGVPDDESAVAKAIVAFSKNLDSDNEYGIEFVQVGRDVHARDYLKRLDDHLTAEGAKFDIVNTKTMEELENTTLTEALIASLDE